MIPAEVAQEAYECGYSRASKLVLSSGETVYLLESDRAKVGLPTYLHYVNGVLVMSTVSESMSLFGEPAFMGDDDALE